MTKRWLHIGRCLSVAAILGCGGAAYAADDQLTRPVATQETSNGITLNFSGENISAEPRGKDLIIRFSNPINEGLRATLEALAGNNWIDTVETGYDSAVFNAAKPLHWTVTRQGMTLIATGVLEANRTSGADADDRAARRLNLAKAKADSLTGHVSEARSELLAIKAETPTDPEPVLLLAEMERREGQWRVAQDLYKQALALDPKNDESRQALGEIRRERTSRVRLDTDFRDVPGKNSMLETVQSGWDLLDNGWLAGANADYGYAKSSGVQPGGGPPLNFYGTRSRGELYLQKDRLDGQAFRGSLYSGTHDGVGLGGSWTVPYDDGQSQLQAEWHRPNWDYIQGFVSGSVRDRFTIGRNQQWGPISASLVTGVQQYSLNGSGANAARSAIVTGNVRVPVDEIAPQPLTFGWMPNLGRDLAVVYGLDAEYPWLVASSTAPDGSTFHPLPDTHHEVHTLMLDLTRQLFDSPNYDHSLVFEPSVGVGVDRFGRAGPIASANLSWDEGPWEALLRASHERHIGQNGDSATTLGGTIMRLF